MKRLFFLVFASVCLCLPSGMISAAEIGQTAAQVLAQHGEPLSRRFNADNKDVWQYPRGQVMFRNGRVMQAVMAGDTLGDAGNPDTPFAPMIPEVAAVAPVAPVEPVVNAVENEQRRAQGERLAAELRSSVDFLVSEPARQMEILRSFQTRYPEVNVNDLLGSVNSVMARRGGAAAPGAEVQGLQQRIAAAEREAAAAEARVEVQRQQLANEVERRRSAERESDRQTYNPYPNTRYYSAPSVVYTPRIYVPSTSHRSYSVQPSCNTGYRSGYSSGYSYRSTPSRSLSLNYRSGLGTLAFGNLTR